MNTVFAEYNLVGPTSSTETAVASVTGGTTRAILGLTSEPLKAQGLFDGRPFKVRVVSQAVATAASNFTVNLYWNSTSNTNLTTFTNDVLIIGSGAQAAASKWATVFMEATCMWDSTSTQFIAFWNETAGAANIPTTPAIIKSSASLIAAGSGIVSSSAVGTPNLVQFFVTHTSSGTTTSSTLLEFAIDRI